MSKVALFFKVDGERVADSIRKVRTDGSGSPIVLDFASVRRIDTETLQVIEALANVAATEACQINFRGVNVEIYKVLKLVSLASRFCFVN